MKRIIIAVGALFAVLAMGLIALPFVLPVDYATRQLQAAIQQATGRTLTIEGSPKLSFWPEFAVEIGTASLSNPEGMYDGRLASMENMRVRVSARALLSREVDVKELTLVRPKLSLVVDSTGRSNWSFEGLSGAEAGDDGSGPSPVAGIRLAPILIEDADIRFLDERTGAAFAARDVDLKITLATPDSPLKVEGSLIWEKERVSFTTFVKRPADLAEQGSPVDLSVESRLIDFSFSGRAALQNGPSLAGQVDVSSPSLRELSGWLGSPMGDGPGLGEFSASASLDLEGRTAKLKDARLELDGMNGQGSVVATLGGPRPKLAVDLGVDRIVIDTYLPKAPEKQSAKGDAGAPDDGWSDTPFDFAGLKAADATMSLSVSEIRYGKVRMANTRVKATLDNGNFSADLSEMDFYGGKAKGRIVLNGSGRQPTIQGALKAGGLDGHALLRDFTGFDRIEGTTGLELSLAAAGRSQREMVSTLRGNASFKFTDGAVRGINVARMIRSVGTSILGGWDKGPEEKTDFALLEASYTIEDGVAAGHDLNLLGPLVRVTGEGKVDMLSQRINYKVEPKVVASLEGQGGDDKLQGIAVPVKIEGPWSSPRIYPDIQGILENPQAAFDALSKLGLTTGSIDVGDAKKAVVDKARGELEKVLPGSAGKELGKALSGSDGDAIGDLAGTLFGGKKKKKKAKDAAPPQDADAADPLADDFFGAQDGPLPEAQAPPGQ